jgi:hypothetical protein
MAGIERGAAMEPSGQSDLLCGQCGKALRVTHRRVQIACWLSLDVPVVRIELDIFGCCPQF